MSGEVDVVAGYEFADGEALTMAKVRVLVEGLVAQVRAGAITETELADGSIGLDKLAEDVLSSIIVPDGSVESDKIATAAVTTSKIANDAVDRTKIAADVAGDAMTQDVDGSLKPVADEVSLTVGASQINIKNGGVYASRIAAGAVTTDKIYDAAVTEGKIAAGAVTATKVGAGAVGTSSLTTNAFGQLQLSSATMTLACTASTDNEWKTWTVTPRASGSTFVVMVAATVTWAGTAPNVTFKLFDDTSEEASVIVTGFNSGEQMVALLVFAPGDTSSHTLRVKVNPDQTCSMGSTSRILWEERVEK